MGEAKFHETYMMQVLIVHAMDQGAPGGAEQSLRYHMEHAPAAFKVSAAHPDDAVRLGAFDAVVLGNLRPRGGLGAEAEIGATLRWAVRLADFEGFSLRSERDVHPCTFRDGRCLTGRNPRKTACDCTMTIRDANQLLYNACSAVQFLSPAHRRAINQLISITRPQHTIAPPIDPRRFRVLTPLAERPPKALILGDAMRVADTAVGRARKAGYEPERIEYLSVPFDEMPRLYNRYQAVVVDPNMFHAFGRVAAEAMACGCRVLASERVGAMSWKDPVGACQVANESFWRLLQKGIEHGPDEISGWRRYWRRRAG